MNKYRADQEEFHHPRAEDGKYPMEETECEGKIQSAPPSLFRLGPVHCLFIFFFNKQSELIASLEASSIN